MRLRILPTYIHQFIQTTHILTIASIILLKRECNTITNSPDGQETWPFRCLARLAQLAERKALNTQAVECNTTLEQGLS